MIDLFLFSAWEQRVEGTKEKKHAPNTLVQNSLQISPQEVGTQSLEPSLLCHISRKLEQEAEWGLHPGTPIWDAVVSITSPRAHLLMFTFGKEFQTCQRICNECIPM